MQFGYRVAIRTNAEFELSYQEKVQQLLRSEPVNRGTAHAMKDNTTAYTHELSYLQEHIEVDMTKGPWAEVVKPNLPWAEDHFQERVSGDPLNPAPSEAWWPFARAGNAEHKKDQKFSHTYPERFWPKYANPEGQFEKHPRGGEYFSRQGIRFPYGDLKDLIEVLKQNPHSRQAYLPIWFPEDIEAARRGERVPCSMGYHFISTGDALDCVYTMRSCDIVRFYRDDVYMAGRLLQHVAEKVGMVTGMLVVNIDNLHCFPGDRLFLEGLLPRVQFSAQGKYPDDPRNSYNFGAL